MTIIYLFFCNQVVALKDDGCPKVWVVTSDHCQQHAAYGAVCIFLIVRHLCDNNEMFSFSFKFDCLQIYLVCGMIAYNKWDA